MAENETVRQQPDEAWEKELLEQLAEESEKRELLDLAQDATIKLSSELGDARHALEFDEPEDEPRLLRRIARVAVLLDALQLLYGDAVEEEIEFLQEIEESFGEGCREDLCDGN